MFDYTGSFLIAPRRKPSNSTDICRFGKPKNNSRDYLISASISIDEMITGQGALVLPVKPRARIRMKKRPCG